MSVQLRSNRVIRALPLTLLVAVMVSAGCQRSSPAGGNRPVALQANGHVSFSGAAHHGSAAVVNISAVRVSTDDGKTDPRLYFDDPATWDLFHGLFGSYEGAGRTPLGSGVLVHGGKFVVTNAHVVRDTTDITLKLVDGRELPADVIATDSASDLAILKPRTSTPIELASLRFGDSSKLRPGDIVLAVGNPFGLGQTVTMGVVSATRRSDIGIAEFEELIQTDVATNPGSSGGPLLAQDGSFVGITTAIASRDGTFQGVSFAIPSDTVRRVVDDLIARGHVVRGSLGIAVQSVTDTLARALGVERNVRGALVTEVVTGSPAARAGVRRGDVIVGFGKDEVTSAGQLRNRVAQTRPGTVSRVELLRGTKRHALQARLTTDMPESEEATEMASPEAVEREATPLAGTTVAAMHPVLRQRYSIPDEIERGIVVVGLTVGSQAAKAGLRPGDVIIEVNREAVTTTEALAKKVVSLAERVKNDPKPRPLLLLIRRGDKTSYIPLSWD